MNGNGYSNGVGGRIPFEGRLLVFKRGNGVEETKGRLVLKKLDYIQASKRK